MQASKAPLHNLPEVDFEVIRESWSKYKLKDGTILSFKPVLVKLLLLEEAEPPKLVAGTQNVVGIRSRERREPKPPEKTLDSLPEEIKREVDVDKVIEEKWNSYRVNIGGKTYIFEIKPVIIRVLKVEGYYDQTGYPIYQVFSTIASRIKEEKGGK